MRSAYYGPSPGKEGFLVEERGGNRPQGGNDLDCLQKASVAGAETGTGEGVQGGQRQGRIVRYVSQGSKLGFCFR